MGPRTTHWMHGIGTVRIMRILTSCITFGLPPPVKPALSPPTTEVGMRLRLRAVAITLGVLVAVGCGLVWYAHRPAKGHPSAYAPSDTALHHDWLYFYPSHVGGRAHALVFFFGNDVAFWEPHQEL